MRAIGIVLAGGNSKRMRELSNKRAIAAMPVAGSFRSVDFVLSNMSNSHIQSVAVLTQYNSRSLNEHLSSSKWWDFGRKQGGMYVFTPTITAEHSDWYRGTADALYQNLDFLKKSHEPYVVIAGGDCIYKLDYHKVLEYHIEKKADITVVCKDMEPEADVTRFGLVKTNAEGRITDFEEKPMLATSNTISCGIYVIRRRQLIELIERCATQLHITAEDNLQFGYIDRVIQEPSLGARPYHYDFFRTLRQEIIRATDETVLSVRSGMFRGALLRRMSRDDINLDEMYIRWHLSQGARERLVLRRQKKFLRLSRGAYIDRRPFLNKMRNSMRESWGNISARIKYALITKHQRKFAYLMDEMTSEIHLLKRRLTAPFCRIPRDQRPSIEPETVRNLTTLSDWDEESESRKGKWTYISPRAKEDRAITCPNAGTHGCLDLWSPDLYGEFAGVCTWCGHHFPMEYQWFVKNVFDEDSVREFNGEVEATNPLQFEGFDARLAEARERTKLKSGCITFEAKLDGTKMIVALFAGTFRGGSVGSAEGTKFVEAAELAMKKRYPLLAYVHGTAGIRIQEGTHGVIQMPRCTVAVRRYINAGGLYTVLYDTNSYAGPVASFLGCSPYQYAMRSSNLGFAGRGVIKETTGIDIEPHYHSAYKALARGHIQGVWDRREARANLKQVLLTMGGRNLYYR